ncbi:hypothetical protein DV735_g1464, partial [Chaetothyriales sp. CBS 134920]
MVRRFERIHEVVENVEEYQPGGFHPVHLGDIFVDRYQVTGKLGFGQFSTVWMAVDLWGGREVALKIIKAKSSMGNHELDIMRTLSKEGMRNGSGEHVVDLLDHFRHTGPNGTHLCLVLPLMISDGHEITVRDRPRSEAYVKNLARQIVLGLKLVKESRLAHCDQHTWLESPEFCAVQWREGQVPDESAPRYLMPSQRVRGALDEMDPTSLIVKLGDFGGGKLFSSWGSQRPVTAKALRPPEVIRGDKWDASIDVWSLGCVVFELATNEPLFALNAFGLDPEELDDEHESLIRARVSVDGGLIDYLKPRLPPTFGDTETFAAFLRKPDLSAVIVYQYLGSLVERQWRLSQLLRFSSCVKTQHEE